MLADLIGFFDALAVEFWGGGLGLRGLGLENLEAEILRGCGGGVDALEQGFA